MDFSYKNGYIYNDPTTYYMPNPNYYYNIPLTGDGYSLKTSVSEQPKQKDLSKPFNKGVNFLADIIEENFDRVYKELNTLNKKVSEISRLHSTEQKLRSTTFAEIPPPLPPFTETVDQTPPLPPLNETVDQTPPPLPPLSETVDQTPPPLPPLPPLNETVDQTPPPLPPQ